MTRSVGVCPVCSQTTFVYRALPYGKYVMRPHERGYVDRCPGTRQPALPTRDQKRRTQTRARLVEPFRVHAAVALDAWIRHCDAPSQYPAYPAREIEVLCDVALQWYRCCHEDAPQAVIRYVPRTGRNSQRLMSGDAYCTFCGVLVWRNVSGLRYGTDADAVKRLARGDRHPVECALKHLAFALVPSGPDVRKLPDEYLEERVS